MTTVIPFLFLLTLASLGASAIGGNDSFIERMYLELVEKVSSNTEMMQSLQHRLDDLEQATFLDPSCPNGWMQFRGSCYGIGAQAITWAAAETACQMFGASLAEVETSEENEFLKGIARTRKYKGLWLGASDGFNSGHWVWIGSKNNLLTGFTDWSPNQPSNGARNGEGCVHINEYANQNYKWNDVNCNRHSQYVCEIRMQTSEE